MQRHEARRHELDRALATAVHQDDPARVAQVHLELARLHTSTGEGTKSPTAANPHYQRARGVLVTAERFASHTTESQLQGEIALERAWVERRLGELDAALEQAGLAEALLTGTPLGFRAAVVRAAVLRDLGRVRVACTLLRQVVQTADAIPEPLPRPVREARRQALAELARGLMPAARATPPPGPRRRRCACRTRTPCPTASTCWSSTRPSPSSPSSPLPSASPSPRKPTASQSPCSSPRCSSSCSAPPSSPSSS